MTVQCSQIYWSRVAEPQADAYDSTIVLSLAAAQGYHRPAVADAPVILDGAVALLPDRSFEHIGECTIAPFQHPSIALAESAIKCWPDGFRQCQTLLHSIAIYDYAPFGSDQIVGSICGAGSNGFGSIAVTVNNHIGLAEGIVHEMAHHKLRMLGVDFEDSIRLVKNDPTALYPSPIRYDCLRPMSAVLHAQYSYTYIAQLDIMVVRGGIDRRRDQVIVERSLAVILPKLEFGRRIIAAEAIADAAGNEFLPALLNWVDRIIAEGYWLLGRFDVPPRTFNHPLTPRKEVKRARTA